MALKTGNAFLDAIGGTPWNDHVITFFFDNNTSSGHSTGGAWSLAERSAFWDALHTWSDVADIRFLEVDSAGGADMIERKVTNAELPGDLAQHSTPGESTHVGEFNTGLNWTTAEMQRGGYTFETFVHELGHAIGLAHPHDMGQGTGLFPGVAGKDDEGDNSLNTVLNTIMSYNEVNVDKSGNLNSTTHGFSATPMAFDIAAIQLLYGAVHHNDGDTVYTLPDANVDGTSYSCIWDTSGIDTIQYNGAKDATLDLRPAWLGNDAGGGGYLSSAKGVFGGFTIAADITGFIPDQNGEWGAIIENAIGGSGNDTIYGNNVDNVLRGQDGNDTINGLGGNDVMLGGKGNDVYVVDQAGDQVYDEPGAAGGRDKVYTSLNSYDLRVVGKGIYIEELQFVGNGNFTGHGNELSNVVVGAAGSDALYGHEGDDYLAGGGGNDTLDASDGADVLNGEAGADTMYGGKGNDTYYVDNVNDVVNEEIYRGSSSGGIYGAVLRPYADAGSNDTIITTLASYDLSKTSTGNNVFSNEVSPGKLYGIVENLIYKGTGSFDGVGNAANNMIVGAGGADYLFGAEGDDVLDGRAGADAMYGGVGGDTYYVDNINDVVNEEIYSATSGPLAVSLLRDAGSLGDTVITTLSSYDLSHISSGNSAIQRYSGTLFGVIENLTYTGTGAFTGTGNAADNVIAGGDGRDHLYGLAGKDTLLGNGGSDTLEGGIGDDNLVGGDGTDTFVFKGAVADLGSDKVEGGEVGGLVDGYGDTLDFTGLDGRVKVDFAHGSFKAFSGSVSATSTVHGIEYVKGTAHNDIMLGNADQNIFLGGGGKDSMQGGGGRDALLGEAGTDTLKGNAGDDLLVGGLGRDLLFGGSGGDVFDYNAVNETGKTSTTRDRIGDFTHGLDDIDLSGIDANGSAAGDAAFKFVAKEGAHLSGVKGQLIWDRQNHSGTANDKTIVMGDINGDKHADFMIELAGLKTLTVGDFVL